MTPPTLRVSPRAAYQEALWDDDVRLVDVRPDARRAALGEVHPALRAVAVGTAELEERLDPRGRARLPWASYDARLLVLGQSGDDAAPLAHALRRLGLWRTAYVVGGFEAWREAGMPVARPCLRIPVSAGGFHAGDVLSAAGPATGTAD